MQTLTFPPHLVRQLSTKGVYLKWGGTDWKQTCSRPLPNPRSQRGRVGLDPAKAGRWPSVARGQAIRQQMGVPTMRWHSEGSKKVLPVYYEGDRGAFGAKALWYPRRCLRVSRETEGEGWELEGLGHMLELAGGTQWQGGFGISTPVPSGHQKWKGNEQEEGQLSSR